MNPGNRKNWQELFIAGAVVAILQMVVIQPPAEAAANILSMKSPATNISTLSVEPGTASSSCAECGVPAALRNRITGLVITTALTDGGYVAVWQNKHDNLVYGQCYSRKDQPRGDVFRINADAKDGILPVILARGDGGFVARWQQDKQDYEQHFDSGGMPLGKEAKLK